MSKLNVYTCDCFEGVYPVGTAAVVIAEDAIDAAKLLNKSLVQHHLLQESPIESKHMEQVHTNEPFVVIINNGDY